MTDLPHDPQPAPAVLSAIPPAGAPDDPAPLSPLDDGAAAVPEKFVDGDSGAVRVDALARSYAELERKLSTMVAVPGADADDETRRQFHRALGVPDSPDDYAIEMQGDLIAPDPGINRRLHEAGFTPAQAQLVYALAEERLMPLVGDLAAEFEAERQTERLVRHFGGAEPWQAARRRLAAWAESHLPAEVYAALSTTHDGVLAIARMMESGEPALGREGGAPAGADAAALERLMDDPRYWRDHDPAVVARVREGFRSLYPEG